jgi:hypothetical protein
MAQGGIIGMGVRVAFATGSPHTYKKLEQVKEVNIPTLQSDKLDTTVHTNNKWKRNIAGLQEVEDMTITMLRDAYTATSPNQNALFDYLKNQTQLWWRIEIPSDPDVATTLFEAYEFQGRVFSFKPTSEMADPQVVEASVVFDGSSFVRYEPYASVIG